VYNDAVDAVSLVEEAGQRRTATLGLETIERFSRRGRLLDIGCWTGAFLEVARDRGWEVLGVEPSRWAASIATARGLVVHHGTLHNVPTALEPVDAIVLADVLEHLWDPGAALRSAREKLRPGGVVYITVPDAGSLVARLLGRRWWSVLPMHVQYFTFASLSHLLAAEGFAVVHVASHPKWFSVGYYADRLVALVPPLRPLVEALPLRLARRLVAPNFRDRLLVVAAS
jgi:SAM-dependent methyltransferase